MSVNIIFNKLENFLKVNLLRARGSFCLADPSLGGELSRLSSSILMRRSPILLQRLSEDWVTLTSKRATAACQLGVEYKYII